MKAPIVVLLGAALGALFVSSCGEAGVDPDASAPGAVDGGRRPVDDAAARDGRVTGDGAAGDGGSAFAAKWHPGIYVKLEDWQLQSPREMKTVYEELRTTPQLRGIRVTLLWGRYETRSGGASTYDFSSLDEIFATMKSLGDKHVILSLAWREFSAASGASLVVPNDLRAGSPWNADPDWAHVQYDYLWAYRMSNRVGEYGYNLKLWNATLISRLDAFLKVLGERYDAHSNLTAIGTTESAIGDPVVAFGPGEGEVPQYQGQLSVVRALRKYFPRSLTIPDLNFSREHVAAMVKLMPAERFGLGSPNSNLSPGINVSRAPMGVLKYYPVLSGKVVLVPEIQGDDFQSTAGAGTVEDHPKYDYLYSRIRDDLKANYTVIQRNFPFWLGNASTPSMLEFIRTYPTIVNDVSGAGGLDSVLPANLR